jgi:hypothetical protein
MEDNDSQSPRLPTLSVVDVMRSYDIYFVARWLAAIRPSFTTSTTLFALTKVLCQQEAHFSRIEML